MEDSDIQFLGNWNSQQASSNNAFVSAIVLAPSDGSPSRTFSRMHTSLVNIGRITSSNPSDHPMTPTPPTEEEAGFVNPVMSRKHAKITFADSGSAFIIDTNSHHGTWVRRPASTKPHVKLTSETPYMLLDGDNITFGKEVIKDGITHHPLTVSVKLLRTSSSVSSPVVAPVDPFSSNMSPKPRNRFGLGNSSDSDSSSDEESSDNHAAGENAICIGLPVMGSRSKSPECISAGCSESSMSESSSSAPSSPPGVSKAPNEHVAEQSNPECTGIWSPFKFTPPSPTSSSSALQPPSLHLSGTVDQPENPAPTHQDLSVRPITPPWRRAGPLFPSNNFRGFSTSTPEIQGHLGKFFKPAWMRASSGREASGSLAQNHSISLLSGVVSRLRGQSHALVREHTSERHGRLLESHEHGVDVSQEVTVVPMDEDGSAMKNEALSSRLNEFAAQLAAVQESTSALKDNLSLAEIPALKSSLTSLENAATVLRGDMATIRDDVSAANVDAGALRVDLTALRTAYKADLADMEEREMIQLIQHTDLRNEVEKLRADLSALPRSVETVPQVDIVAMMDRVAAQVTELRGVVDKLCADLAAMPRSVDTLSRELDVEMGSIRGELGDLHKCFEGLEEQFVRVEMESRNASEGYQGLEENIMQRVHAEIRRASKEPVAEQSPSRKRKREDDEEFSSHKEARISAITVPEARSSKRLRTVVDYAAAGVLGAFGAYIGLAYLQL